MTTRRTRLAATFVAAPLALALVACGGDDSDTDADDSRSSTSTEETPSTDPTTSTSDPAGAAATGDTAGLLAAAETALGEVAGAEVFSIDAEPTGWEVTLVAADGTESEVAIAADGTVARGPVTDPDDTGADEADDLAERQRLLTEATLDHAAAVEAAQGSLPDGTVSGLELDLTAGKAVWEVHFDEDTATEQTVTVDAATGAVLGTETDD